MSWTALAAMAAALLIPTVSTAEDFVFHLPDDAQSAASLNAHLAAIDGLMPAWMHVSGPTDAIALEDDPGGRAAIGRRKGLPVLPLINNVSQGQWHGQDTAALLASQQRRQSFLSRLEAELTALNAAGAIFDFETLPPGAQADYLSFLAEAQARFAKRGWRVAVAVPAGDPAWDLKAYGRAADLVLLMAYDEHWGGGAPGPIASNPWFDAAVARAAAVIPARKLLVGLAVYGRDWTQGGPSEDISAPEALARARKSGVQPRRDPGSGNMGFTYTDQGRVHAVWYLDADTIGRQMALARGHGARNFAFWRLGLEDPAVWSVFGRKP